MRVSVHQPNFCAWLPFFQKMAVVDVFVILRHCQWEKGLYQNRFKIGETWHTMSVNHGLEPIIKKQYVNPREDWDRIKNKLAPAYGAIPEIFDESICSSLHETNTSIIRHAAALLGIKTTIVLDEPTQLTGTDRLVKICQQWRAKTYLAGLSGSKYLEVEKFGEAGIKVEFQKLEEVDRKPLFDVLKQQL